jgi:hypothetical protein
MPIPSGSCKLQNCRQTSPYRITEGLPVIREWLRFDSDNPIFALRIPCSFCIAYYLPLVSFYFAYRRHLDETEAAEHKSLLPLEHSGDTIPIPLRCVGLEPTSILVVCVFP